MEQNKELGFTDTVVHVSQLILMSQRFNYMRSPL